MKKTLVLLIAMMSACNHVQESGLIPDGLGIDDFMPTEEPEEGFETYEVYEYFEISRVEKNQNQGYEPYYTVYGVNLATGIEECIADDVSEEWASNEPWLITVGMTVELVYEAGQPSYTGELFPAYSEGFN